MLALFKQMVPNRLFYCWYGYLKQILYLCFRLMISHIYLVKYMCSLGVIQHTARLKKMFWKSINISSLKTDLEKYFIALVTEIID